MSSNLKIVNEFVSDFLVNNGDSESIEGEWSSDDNQSRLKALFVSCDKKVKKVKDPNAPKRAKSSYLFFCAAERIVIKDEGSELSAKDVTSELGRRWNLLKEKGADSLKGYAVLAAEDKERYALEKAEYIPPPDICLINKGKKIKDPNAPKRAKSSYLFFCASERIVLKEDNSNLSAKDVTSELGRRWNLLKEDSDRSDELETFTQMAVEDKERYATEKEAWKPTDKASVKKVVTKKAPVKKVVTKKAPVKKAPVKKVVTKKKPVNSKSSSKKAPVNKTNKKISAYQLYSQEHRAAAKEENEDMKAKEITKLLGDQWKALSKDEQKVYKDRS
jgi:hypothetical protein